MKKVLCAIGTYIAIAILASCAPSPYIRLGRETSSLYLNKAISDLEVIIKIRDSVPEGKRKDFLKGLSTGLDKKRAERLFKAASSEYYGQGVALGNSLRKSTEMGSAFLEFFLDKKLSQEDSLGFLAGFLSKYGKEGFELITLANQCIESYKKGRDVGAALKDTTELWYLVIMVDSVDKKCWTAVKLGIQATSSLASISINSIFQAVDLEEFRTGITHGIKLKGEEIEPELVRNYMADRIPIMTDIQKLAFCSGFIKGYGEGGVAMYRSLYQSLGLKD